MANICSNEMYVSSEDSKNLEVVKNFFNDWEYASVEEDDDHLDIYFDSKWTFPEKEMEKLFNLIPNKDDIYMRVLSVEYGNDYIGYHKCDDEDGWYNAL